MTAPIPVRVTRYQDPHCGRTHSSRRRAVEHMARCWRNPEARGCLTCRHFEPVNEQCCGMPDINGCFTPWCDDIRERCAVGVSLEGRPACERCQGAGVVPFAPDQPTECEQCGGDGAPIKAGPIVHCENWEARND